MNEKITKVIGSLTTVKLTKERGEKLLAGCTNERKLKTRHVEFIKRSLIYSGWNNSSTISVCEDGELLDGQHRLHALKELGWPLINIQICTYAKKDINPALRSSFNKAVKQSVADTMKMCYGWDNVTRRCGICSVIYKAFIHKGNVKCDDVATLAVDKCFGDEIAEFVTTKSPHEKGKRSFRAEIVGSFVAMRIFKGASRAGEIQTLRFNSECRLNCESNNCIAARINDYAFTDRRGHGGEKICDLYRICMAIDMALNGKRVCPPLEKFKYDDVHAFGDTIRPVIQKRFDEVDF